MEQRGLGNCGSYSLSGWIDDVQNSGPELKIASKSHSLSDNYLLELSEKRDHVLPKIVNLLRSDVNEKFANSNYFSLTYHCLNIIKKGSTTNVNLACQAIGLLSVSINSEDTTASHDILEEIISPFSQALTSTAKSSNISALLECLAIVTIMGAANHLENERSMQIIWQVANSNFDNSHKLGVKPNAQALGTAISSWSFLLTSMQIWDVNPTKWKRSICYISSLLHNDDRTICMAAATTSALIFEMKNFDKFYDQEAQHLEILKNNIINQMRKLSFQVDDEDSDKQDVIYSQSKLFHKVGEFLQHGFYHEASINIGKGALKIPSWSRLIQVNFMKRILGDGFKRHMQKNETLQDLLDYVPMEKIDKALEEEKLYFQREKESIHYVYQPILPKYNRQAKRLLNSPNSCVNKARTQLRNKNRAMSQATNFGSWD